MYTVFSGCSFTQGNGFELEKEEPVLWCNQLYQELFSSTSKLNVGVGGASNTRIFQETVHALVSFPVKYAIVEWTSYPRYELELGFETYKTFETFSPSSTCRDHNLHNINYTGKYLDSIKNKFISLSHDCYEILNILKYTNDIIKLAHLTKTQVFFVNGLCYWDVDFFDKKTNVLPNQFTPYTQELLCTSTRDDSNAYELYDKMHQGFKDSGGINHEHWLNLYKSLKSSIIDTNSDGIHPGINSNNLYFDLLAPALSEKLN
jgi:hypothetical protein